MITFDTSSRPRIAYLTTAFPVRSETGVIREMHILDQELFDVHVFSIRPLSFHGIYEPKANAFKTRAAGFSSEVALEGALATAKRLAHGERGFLSALKTTFERSGTLLPKTLAILVLATGLAARVEALGISYLHANFASLQAFAAWVVHHLTGISYGFTMHAYDLFEQGFMMEEKVRDASVVVSVSQYNVRYIQQRWGIATHGIHVIHSGIDLCEFRSCELAASCCGCSPWVVCIPRKVFPISSMPSHYSGTKSPCASTLSAPAKSNTASRSGSDNTGCSIGPRCGRLCPMRS
jgi:Glycosyltransferase Family 4